jgi:hypothetical protein
MPTSDQLRQAIDNGRGGDKIPFVDPAAAPLGTDDEAGGNPPSREELEMAARSEIRGKDGFGPGATDERSRPLDGRYFYWQQARSLWPLVVGFLIAVVVVIAAITLSR